MVLLKRCIKIKITIDTKEDSHDEIKKVIKMLQHLVGGGEVFSNQKNIFEEPSSEVQSQPAESGNVLGNLFGDDSAQNKPDDKPEDITQTEEKKEDTPQITPYEF